MVLRLTAAVAEYCPHCDSDTARHNCAAVESCRVRPKGALGEMLKHVAEDGGKDADTVAAFRREIARNVPELAEWDNDVDRVAALECELARVANDAVAAAAGDIGGAPTTDVEEAAVTAHLER